MIIPNKLAVVITSLFLLITISPNTVFGTSSDLNEEIWTTNGRVYDMVDDGQGTLYIGGSFTYVGPNTNSYGELINATTAGRDPAFPQVNGAILDVISDEAGGYYIGGTFTQVGSISVSYVAHILHDGSVDETFQPTPNSWVTALAKSGSTVYLGGSFTELGNQERSSLAAVNSTTGVVEAWNPDPVFIEGEESYPAEINELKIAGSVIYVGGWFTHIGEQERNNLAAIDTETGLANNWNPNVIMSGFWGDMPGNVLAIELAGDDVLIGGDFNQVGGVARSEFARFDSTGNLDLSCDPNLYTGIPGLSTVYAIEVNADNIYLGGSFTHVGGEGGTQRNGLAKLDYASCSLADWDPAVTTINQGDLSRPTIKTMIVEDDSVYFGGFFHWVGNQRRNNLAAVSTSTGLATNWDPGVGEESSFSTPDWSMTVSEGVQSMVKTNDDFYVGGNFSSVGGVARTSVAAINLQSGEATSWNPKLERETIDGFDYPTVSNMAWDDNILYLAGSFSSVNNEPRSGLAAINTQTGLTTPFNPEPNDDVHDIEVDEHNIYLGGKFTSLGGTSRKYLATVDKTTNSITSLDHDPQSFGYVRDLEIDGSTLYVAGDWYAFNSTPQPGLVAIDLISELVKPWSANVGGGGVQDIAIDGNILYLAGNFTTIGGISRNRIAAVSTETGVSTSWNPSANGDIKKIALTTPTIFAIGDFTQIGVQSRDGLAEINRESGLVTNFNPEFNPNPTLDNDDGDWLNDLNFNSVYSTTNDVMIGGNFLFINNNPTSWLAAFQFDIAAPEISLITLSPSPTSDSTPTFTGAISDNSTILSVEFQVDGTDGSWMACSVADGVFDEQAEDFSCTVTTPLTSGSHTVYFRGTDSEGNTTNSGSETSYTFTISAGATDVDTTPPSRSFTVVGDDGREYQREFKQQTLLNQEVVGYNHNPQFCFSTAGDTGSGVKEYSVKVDDGDYLTSLKASPPPNGDEGNTRVESSGATIKESNDKWIKWEGFTKIEDVDRICVYGKGDSKFLNTGLHTWEVVARDEAGNTTSVGKERFLVNTHSGSEGKESGKYYPLSILMIGNRSKLDYSTENPELFTESTKALTITDTTPTIYGLASVGSHITLMIDKETTDSLGQLTRTQVVYKNTDTNINSEWGINLTEALSTGTYYLTVEAADDYHNYAVVKDVLMTIGQTAATSTTISQVLGEATEIARPINEPTPDLDEDHITPLSDHPEPTATSQPNTPQPQPVVKQSFFDRIAQWVVNLIR